MNRFEHKLRIELLIRQIANLENFKVLHPLIFEIINFQFFQFPGLINGQK